MTHHIVPKDLNLQRHICENASSHNKIIPFRDKNCILNKTVTVESKSQVETPSDIRSSRNIGDTDVEGTLTVRDRRMEKTLLWAALPSVGGGDGGDDDDYDNKC